MTFDLGGEIECDRFAGSPVGGYLQDCGAAESAVGDQHLFAEAAASSPRSGVRRRLRRRRRRDRTMFAVFGAEDERDEGWSAGHDAQAELSGEVVAEGGGAHLWDGQAAGCDDDGVGSELDRGRFDAEMCVCE